MKKFGRPLKYKTDQEKKDAIKHSKTKYMLNKEWHCHICDPNKNYTLAGKHSHLKTIKHQNNMLNI